MALLPPGTLLFAALGTASITFAGTMVQTSEMPITADVPAQLNAPESLLNSAPQLNSIEVSELVETVVASSAVAPVPAPEPLAALALPETPFERFQLPEISGFSSDLGVSLRGQVDVLETHERTQPPARVAGGFKFDL